VVIWLWWCVCVCIPTRCGSQERSTVPSNYLLDYLPGFRLRLEELEARLEDPHLQWLLHGRLQARPLTALAQLDCVGRGGEGQRVRGPTLILARARPNPHPTVALTLTLTLAPALNLTPALTLALALALALDLSQRDDLAPDAARPEPAHGGGAAVSQAVDVAEYDGQAALARLRGHVASALKYVRERERASSTSSTGSTTGTVLAPTTR
jgi:hypothetical protein